MPDLLDLYHFGIDDRPAGIARHSRRNMGLHEACKTAAQPGQQQKHGEDITKQAGNYEKQAGKGSEHAIRCSTRNCLGIEIARIHGGHDSTTAPANEGAADHHVKDGNGKDRQDSDMTSKPDEACQFQDENTKDDARQIPHNA